MTMKPSGHDDVYSWLNAALFSRGGFEIGRKGGRWAALPNPQDPRRFVPLDAAGATAAFTNVHDAMSTRRLRAGAVTRRVVRTGLIQRAARKTISLAPELDLDGDPQRSALAQLRSSVPKAEHVAITVGPRRANRKPVVQLIDGEGAVIGFAKVGADDTSSRLVTNEAQALTDHHTNIPATPDASLRVPELLAQVAWDDRPIVVIEAAPPSSHDPGYNEHRRRVELARAIAPVTRRCVSRLRDTDLILEVDRLVAVCASDELARSAGRALEQLVETFGDEPVVTARWHGDMTPWNMISSRDHTWLLDWEFSTACAPVGADLWHHEVMTDTHLRSVPLDQALHTTHRRAGFLLRSMDVDTAPDPAFALYLIELVRRSLWLAETDASSLEFLAGATRYIGRMCVS